MVKKKRKTVYVAKSTGRVWDTREEAARDNAIYNKDIHYRYSIKAGRYNSPLKNYNIPFIPEKKITLTNAGLATGAVLSTNLLDSIAVNAERAGLPIKTAIGLATKESTLNNPTYDIRNRAKIAAFERSELKKAKALGFEENIKPKQNIGTGDTPEGLLINYNPDDNPYQRATSYIIKKAKNWEDNLRMMKETEAYADKQAIRNQAKPSKSYLQAGFEAYKKNPKRYNPGQSNYSQLVDKRGEEVWGSPEVKNWYKTYRKRRFEEGGKIMPKRSLENRGHKDSSFWNTIDNYANYAEKALALSSLASTGATIAAPNPITAGLALGSNIGGAVVDGYQGIRSAIKGDYGNAIKNGAELVLSLIGAKALSNASKLSKLDAALRASGAPRQYVTKTIGRRAATRHTYVETKEADAAGKASGIGYGASIGGNASSFGELPTRNKHKNGGIHIAPSKRGTFTAAATKHGMGVQEFASKVLANKENYSPAMVKKANFARNANKWNN